MSHPHPLGRGVSVCFGLESRINPKLPRAHALRLRPLERDGKFSGEIKWNPINILHCIIGIRNSWSSKFLIFEALGLRNFWLSKLLAFETAGLRNSWSSKRLAFEIAVFEILGLRNSWSSKLLVLATLGLRNCFRRNPWPSKPLVFETLGLRNSLDLRKSWPSTLLAFNTYWPSKLFAFEALRLLNQKRFALSKNLVTIEYRMSEDKMETLILFRRLSVPV